MRKATRAVPELLKMIDVSGNIVTADAMSCQRNIVAQIVRHDADYVIGLKDNQRTLFADARAYFEDSGLSGWVRKATGPEKGHGRIECRTARLLTDIDWLEQKGEWAGRKGLGCVTAKVTMIHTGEVHEYTRYFISDRYRRIHGCSQKTLAYREQSALEPGRHSSRR